MPDVTSTLLAMYQQIIGGSSAREQASLEAECARRIITSGLSVAPGGTVTLPGNVTIGGTLSVVNFSVTGSFSVPGAMTVGTLGVTGAATVGGLLTASAGLAVTGAASVTGGLLTAGGGLAVTGAASVTGGLLTAGGGLTVTGAVGVTGGNVSNQWSNPAGAVNIGVQNTAVATLAVTRVNIGNDTDPALLGLYSLSSAYVGTGYLSPNGSAVYQTGAGGLSLVAAHAAGILRVFTGGAATPERLRVTAAGELLVNVTAPFGGGRLIVAVDQAVNGNAINVQNLNASNGLGYLAFYNSAGVVAGYVLQTGATTVNYVTSSDARLKVDAGRATDLSALRGVIVHDFRWQADLLPDRGIFAQEAYALYPRAVTPGTDDRTASGDLAQPWMTDYSKFVPDLIVGWQQHETELAALRAMVAGRAA